MSDKEGEQAVAAVRKVIEAQQEAWNRGDTVTRGWQTVLDRYKEHYDTREKMGTLDFSELEFKPVSPFYVLATGRWALANVPNDPHGRFTLLFRRTNAGWRIVHDHTS